MLSADKGISWSNSPLWEGENRLRNFEKGWRVLNITKKDKTIIKGGVHAYELIIKECLRFLPLSALIFIWKSLYAAEYRNFPKTWPTIRSKGI